jgi:hypothetical protein
VQLHDKKLQYCYGTCFLTPDFSTGCVFGMFVRMADEVKQEDGKCGSGTSSDEVKYGCVHYQRKCAFVVSILYFQAVLICIITLTFEQF